MVTRTLDWWELFVLVMGFVCVSGIGDWGLGMMMGVTEGYAIGREWGCHVGSNGSSAATRSGLQGILLVWSALGGDGERECWVCPVDYCIYGKKGFVRLWTLMGAGISRILMSLVLFMIKYRAIRRMRRETMRGKR